MDLTELERRRLADIESGLRLQDPGLDRALSGRQFRHRREHSAGTALVTASMVTFAVGVITHLVLVLIAGWALWSMGLGLRRFAD